MKANQSSTMREDAHIQDVSDKVVRSVPSVTMADNQDLNVFNVAL